MNRHSASIFIAGVALCAISAYIVTTGAGCSGGSRAQVSADGVTRFVIAVVGEGVPDNNSHGSPQQRPSYLNRTQGLAMWGGAVAAFSNSPRFKSAFDSLANSKVAVSLVGFDDQGKPDKAADIAQRLRGDPRVLAVIGHAQSGATQAGAWLYEQAGIPLLMPIATSDSAVYPPGKEGASQFRLRNCLRLVPGDANVQAPVIFNLVAQRLKAEACCLVSDTTPGASTYSLPLSGAIKKLLTDRIVYECAINGDTDGTRLPSVAAAISAKAPAAIIFCGYGTTADAFIGALRTAYASPRPGRERPVLVLSDGCKKSLNVLPFDTYLTFPVGEISSYGCAGEEIAALDHCVRDFGEHLYQMYSYDAVLMIGDAIRASLESGVVSRSSVTAHLQAMVDFKGACLTYSFRYGENIRSRYYVYRASTNDPSATQFTVDSIADLADAPSILFSSPR